MKKQGINVGIGAILGLVCYTYLSYSFNGVAPPFAKQFDDYLFALLVGAIAGFIYFLSGNLLNRKFHWHQHTALRFSVGYVIHSISIVAFVGLVCVVLNLIFRDGNTFLLSFPFEDIHLKLLIIVLFAVFLAEITEFSFFSFNHYSTLQIEEEQQKRHLLNLQFEALRSQLSPHYLFNSLNTVSSLLYRDSQVAEQFVRDLAASFNYILQTHAKKLVSLVTELEMTQAYSHLMEVRFENSFNLKVSIDEKYHDTKIPPLSLQMLIENALKHNTLSEEKPLDIQVSVLEGKFLEVRNPFRPKPGHVVLDNKMLRKPPTDLSMKVGLENIRKRYTFFTPREVIVECKEDFVVRLPLIAADHEA